MREDAFARRVDYGLNFGRHRRERIFGEICQLSEYFNSSQFLRLVSFCWDSRCVWSSSGTTSSDSVKIIGEMGSKREKICFFSWLLLLGSLDASTTSPIQS